MIWLLLATGGAIAALIAPWGRDAAHDALEEIGMLPGRWFTWDQLTVTNTGQPNPLTDEGRANLRKLVEFVLDPLREAIDRPIRVTSAWRSSAVNDAIHGSANKSQHMKGEAADIFGEGMTSRELAQAVIDAGIPFDQLIWYAPSRGGHVHISFNTSPRGQRYQVLHAPDGGGYRADTILPTPEPIA